MSPHGKWLLEHCDNNLVVDLGIPHGGHWQFSSIFVLRLRMTAIHLGITIKGGS